jgi:hypothetical protein
MWRNTVVEDFVEWLRVYNMQNKKKFKSHVPMQGEGKRPILDSILFCLTLVFFSRALVLSNYLLSFSRTFFKNSASVLPLPIPYTPVSLFALAF